MAHQTTKMIKICSKDRPKNTNLCFRSRTDHSIFNRSHLSKFPIDI